jgi:PASTA domain
MDNDTARIQPSIIQRRLGPKAAAGVGAADQINPIAGQPTTGFNAHAGEVMASPRVFAIYWGRDYGSPATGMNARAVEMDRFLTTVMPSRYFTMLAEYLVGPGSFLGSTWVDHAPGLAQTFSLDGIRAVLGGWLDAGLAPQVPGPDEMNLVFLIFPPAEVTLTDNGGNGGFCGYHYSGLYHKGLGKANLFFAVVDTTGGTSAVAHELAETATDRSGNGWFSDDGDHPEIGDVCSGCGSVALSLGSFTVASYWLVNESRCLQQDDLTPPPPPPEIAVPDVRGQAAAEAISALQSRGFAFHEQTVVDNTCNNIGQVLAQNPAGGTEEPKGSAVTIFVAVRPAHPCP